MRHLSNLVDLTIKDCEELDFSEDESGDNILDFHGGLLHSLRSVDIINLPKLESLPRWLLQLTNLERLQISDCSNLKELPEQIGDLQSLQRLYIKWCPSLTSLPEGMRRLASLTHLCIEYCGELEGCLRSPTSLESLDISYYPRLTSLEMRHLSNLVDLSISNCSELDLSKDESGNIILDFHGGLLHNLRYVEIWNLRKLESLPQWLLQASNLESLRILYCSNLKEIPEQIGDLQSLQRLEFCNCPSLTSLPEGMRRLTSLTYLKITYCEELEERSKRDGGEDWYKIAHIPHMSHS